MPSYTSARTGLLSPVEIGGISKLLGVFALPALLFQNLATTDLSTIQWSFVGGVALAKFIVFALVVGLTYISEKKRSLKRTGRGMVEAGLRGRKGEGEKQKERVTSTYLFPSLPPSLPPSHPPSFPSGIMATQSNDFAFGIPICTALYSSTHPEYISFIYLLAPISLASLKPFPLPSFPSLPSSLSPTLLHSLTPYSINMPTLIFPVPVAKLLSSCVLPSHPIPPPHSLSPSLFFLRSS